MINRFRRGFLWNNPRFDIFERFGHINASVIARPPKVDLRQSYKKVFESSLIAVLLLLIVAFRFLPLAETKSRVMMVAQEIVQVEDIAQTRQDNRPPPPPKPPIPIEELSDVGVLEDVTIASTELDVSQEVVSAPPHEEFPDDEQFFVVVEEMPEIIGGMQEILKHVVYPKSALRAGIAGRVFVAAYVDKKGNVVKTEVLQGVGSGLDEAAQRAVEKVRFIPGRQRGKPVGARVMIPVRFEIDLALG
ncbi:MAG: energy transducer TonB [Bacteroidota bacterium]